MNWRRYPEIIDDAIFLNVPNGKIMFLDKDARPALTFLSSNPHESYDVRLNGEGEVRIEGTIEQILLLYDQVSSSLDCPNLSTDERSSMKCLLELAKTEYKLQR